MLSSALFARALVLVVASRLLLRRHSTTDSLRRLARGDGSERRLDPLDALTAVRRAARIMGGACLPQAVALTGLLQRAGHEPALVLGTHRDARREWSAHAWVEVDQLVLEPVITVEHESLAKLTAANGWTPSPPKQNGGAD